MSIYETTHGTAYANDPDFDTYRGRVTHHSEIVGITLDGWKVRRTVTVIDLGKPAPLAATNPNVLIADNGTDEDGNPRQFGKMQRKTRELHSRVCDLLRQKPMTPREIADALGESFYRIQGFFRNQPVGFVVVRRTEHDGFLWGLAQ